jgi:hypothetical protein
MQLSLLIKNVFIRMASIFSYANFIRTPISNKNKWTLINCMHPNLMNFSAPCEIGFERGKSPAKINHSRSPPLIRPADLWKRGGGPLGRNNASTPSLIMSLIEASIIIKALAGPRY